MNKLVIVVSILLLSHYGYGQVTFDKGYFVGSDGQRIECEIKNLDWSKNPTKFTFRTSETGEEKRASIETVKEFGIYNYSKFLRKNVQIDDSDKRTEQRNPTYSSQVVFLEVLIEGKSNLYQYRGNSSEKYFYSTEKSPEVTQLVYKEYLTPNGQLAKSNYYQQQLLNHLTCLELDVSRVESISYRKKDLTSVFIKSNTCVGHEFTNYADKGKRDLFNLSLRARMNSSSLELWSADINPDFSNTDFGDKIEFGLGIEAEFILPFNKNKWAITIEPTYQSFASQTESSTVTAQVNYSTIEFPLGIRYYLFLNENAKFFFNGTFTNGLVLFDLPESAVEYSTGRDLEIDSGGNFGLGFGYKHRDKYTVEVRIQENRGVLGSYQFWSSEYQTLSLIVGYTLF